ncbi:MAG: hypothetical protein ACRCY9_12660 [Phycicoccus sp.]
MTAPQVAARWLDEVGSAVKIVERRVRVWTGLGLVTSQRVLAGVPAVHSLTREGMRAVGLEGPVRVPSVGQLRHDLAVTDCATWLWRAEGVSMLTEREIRAADPATSTSPRWALRAAPESGRRLVYPDLITIRDGVGLAHEVEASPKEHRRLVALMTAYVQAEHLARVRYYAPERLLGRVERAAAEANERAGRYGRERTVFVTGWEWVQS